MKKKQKISFIKKLTINKINMLKKPSWIKIKVPSNLTKINSMKNFLRNNMLHSVCEEACCPNLIECFNRGIATFMILGSTCTRKCPFCAVFKGRPDIPDTKEPKRLMEAIVHMNVNYVVITSVNRDDLKDGGSKHFTKCIRAIRKIKNVKIEILVPDFRNCVNKALKYISLYPPDVFNHNLENVPRLYNIVRPGASYSLSLKLLEKFKYQNPNIPTKSGLMLGLGETDEEIFRVMRDLRSHGVTMLTLGQYLQPSTFHLPVKRYVSPLEFKILEEEAISLGFTGVYCGPLVRSSYHASSQYVKPINE